MDKSEEYFQQGLMAYKQGNVEAAAKNFVLCLQKDPLHSKAIYYHAQALEEVTRGKYIGELSETAQNLFLQNKFIESLLEWHKILQEDPNNDFAKTYLEKTKEAIREGQRQGITTPPELEDDYFQQGLRAFKEKKYGVAIAYWEAILTANSEHAQARQGLNKARSSQIQKREAQDQERTTQINTYLQQGLDLYGAGEILKALRMWIKILELDLDNKDALDYIVVAKADLNELEYEQLREKLPGTKPTEGAVVEQATDTIILEDSSSEPSHDDDFAYDDLADDQPDLIHQDTDRTMLTPEFGDNAEEDTSGMILPEEPDDLLLDEEDPAQLDLLSDPDEIKLDDEYSDMDSSYDDEPDEKASILEPSFDDDDVIDDVPLLDDELDDDLAMDGDDMLDPEELGDASDDHLEILDDALDEDYELDDEFIEEEEEEQALAAEHEALMGDSPDGDSAKSLIEKYMNRGKTLLRQRNYEEAIIEWKKICDIDKQNEEAKEYIEKAITLYEASPFIEEHLAKGEEFFQNEKYEEAIQEFEKILEIDPELEDALDGIERSRAKLTEVVIPARQSKKVSLEDIAPDEVKKSAGFSLSDLMQPKILGSIGGFVVIVLLIAGYFFYYQPLMEKKAAEEVVRRAQQEKLEREQQIANLLNDAKIQIQVQRFQDAKDGFVKILQMDPQNEEAIAGLEKTNKLEKIFNFVTAGDEYLAKKEFDNAVAEYRNALELGPERPDVIEDKITDTLSLKTTYLEAKDKVREIIKAGDVYFQEGEYKRAIGVYRNAFKILPGDLEVKDAIKRAEFEERRGINVAANIKLGISRYESRKYPQAKEYFNKALELDPENREAKFYLAKIKEHEALFQ